MKIEVRLFATFRNGRFKKSTIEYNKQIMPKDIIKDLKIKPEEVAILLINGISSDINTPLKDKDTLSLFPPVGGG